MKCRSAVFLLVFCVTFSTFMGPLWAGEVRSDTPAVGVRQFMKQVDRYPGPVTVEGVVSQVFPKHKMLALIDVQELKECKVVTCAQLTLPVRWNGSMPKIESIVRVDGEIREEGKHLVFFAKTLKNIE